MQRCWCIARVISAEELGTMSKNNFKRITLVRGHIWGIHSLTLIISWYERDTKDYVRAWACQHKSWHFCLLAPLMFAEPRNHSPLLIM